MLEKVMKITFIIWNCVILRRKSWKLVWKNKNQGNKNDILHFQRFSFARKKSKIINKPKKVWIFLKMCKKSIILRKTILLGVKQVTMSLQSSKMEFGLQNKYSRVIHRTGILLFDLPNPKTGHWGLKNEINRLKILYRLHFKGQRGENKPLELKNQYDRINPLIGNFIWNKNKYTFRGQKDKK
jgi:hypothetical protein